MTDEEILLQYFTKEQLEKLRKSELKYKKSDGFSAEAIKLLISASLK